jgi:hypothetical protein
VQSEEYWSATSELEKGGAWDVFLLNGIVSGHPKTVSLFVWCVRGGQGVDAQ